MRWRWTAVLALVLLLVLPQGLAAVHASEADDDGPSETRASWTVTRFVERRTPVDVNFETSRINETYHVAVPNSAVITSASMTLEGIARYSLKGTPNDFADAPPLPHHGYGGATKQYPPVSSPTVMSSQSVHFTTDAEQAIQRLDGATHQTTTSYQNQPPPNEYPYHLFDMKVNKTGIVRLGVEWHGWGYCRGNKTNTHGAELWIWNYTSTAWERLGSFAANDTGDVVHSFSRTFHHPHDYLSTFGHVNLLAFGQRDERNPLGFPDTGSVATDYTAVTVLVNDTLEEPSDLELSIGDDPAFWSFEGALSGVVTVGTSSNFGTAIQAYVNSIPPAPGQVDVPLVFTLYRSTWGEIRVRDLAVAVREVDNQPPRFLGAKDVTMTEDEDLSRGLDLWDHFTDDLQGSELDYSVVFAENASAVRAEIHADGHHVNFITVAQDWAGTLAFRFNATDKWGLASTSTDFNVTVQEVNDPPVLVDPGNQYLDEDAPFELNVTVLDPDVPFGDVLAFGDDAELFDIDQATGTIAFTPLQAHVGTYEVTITVTDSKGMSDSVTFSITIVDINDRPVIQDPGVLTAYEGRYFSHNFTATDEDRGDTFTWQLVGGVGTMFLGSQNGWLTWVPENEHVGVVNVSIIARDRLGAAHQLWVHFDVVNVNDPPELEALNPLHLTEGLRFQATIGFSDPDLGVDLLESHTFAVDPPMFNISVDGAIDFVPGNDDVGKHVLNVTITDRAGLTHTAQWAVEVLNTNQPPAIQAIGEQFWKEDHPVYLVVVAHDPDAGDQLTFSDATSMFDIDPRTGVINFTPVQANVGSHSLEVRVRDRAGLYGSVFFQVTIAPTNDAPVVSIRVETIKERLREGDMLSLAAVVTDEDDDRYDLIFTWSLDGKQRGSQDTITLRNLAPGHHVVELKVNDGEAVAREEYAFTVEEVEEAFPWASVAAVLVTVLVIAVVIIKVVRPLLARATAEKRHDDKRPPY